MKDGTKYVYNAIKVWKRLFVASRQINDACFCQSQASVYNNCAKKTCDNDGGQWAQQLEAHD